MKAKVSNVYCYDFFIPLLYFHFIEIVMQLLCLFTCHMIFLRFYYSGRRFLLFFCLIIEIAPTRRIIIISVNMTEKVHYINVVVIVCVYFFEH